ncbi:hypothetical protein NIES2100_76690 [Calothrix sp. NIES-2100]|uniref:hypothetical protein n=1 Tax=Calothrix sp. NIES-2100 TaxID=1954172 RepID=UPI000B5F569A|nr:hypothetical protein NIES2100_76690 [Calothrix sp. NIES-2100]
MALQFESIISQLGLVQGGEAQVETAAGMQQGRIFRDVELSIGERQGTFDCLELTDVPYALLGVTPMEVLGLEPDLKNRKLRVLPIILSKPISVFYKRSLHIFKQFI